MYVQYVVYWATLKLLWMNSYLPDENYNMLGIQVMNYFL